MDLRFVKNILTNHMYNIFSMYRKDEQTNLCTLKIMYSCSYVWDKCTGPPRTYFSQDTVSGETIVVEVWLATKLKLCAVQMKLRLLVARFNTDIDHHRPTLGPSNVLVLELIYTGNTKMIQTFCFNSLKCWNTYICIRKTLFKPHDFRTI